MSAVQARSPEETRDQSRQRAKARPGTVGGTGVVTACPRLQQSGILAGGDGHGVGVGRDRVGLEPEDDTSTPPAVIPAGSLPHAPGFDSYGDTITPAVPQTTTTSNRPRHHASTGPRELTSPTLFVRG
jgi:hypothetical protein